MSPSPVRLASRPLPVPAGPRLTSALACAHARSPFSPVRPRDAARRVSRLAEEHHLEAVLFRGGVDVGGAELDHVWVVIGNTVVVDVSLPLRSDRFADELRAYVAGDLSPEELDRIAHGYAFEWRVLGSFPDSRRYVGRPVWGSSTHRDTAST